jgi:hypothetical protein
MTASRNSVIAALLLAAGTIGAACSSGVPSATPTSTTSTLPGAGWWTHFVDNDGPTELPASCNLSPRLAPVTPTPIWPTGYQILDAVPDDLVEQFPTIYGGIRAVLAKPGEPAVQVNSNLVVLETEHDPALETEVRAAYPVGITVAFELTPWSMACLNDIDSSITAAGAGAAKAGITIEGWGIGRGNVVVRVSACSAKSELVARKWFARRWGVLVAVQPCQKPAVATSGIGFAHA